MGDAEKKKAVGPGAPTAFDVGTPKGTRTPVAAVRGRSPRPLDDGSRTATLLRGVWYYTQMFSWLKHSVKKIVGGRNSAPLAPPVPGDEPRIISRDQHGISRSNISEHALKVLYRLNKAGYQAYLVGGGVRDLLLGHEPKDFDIATDATPEQVKALFRNCRLIGRRFRLAHVFFGRDIIEVATFRARHDNGGDGKTSAEGMLLRDNVYGTLEDDAWRRDFSVNALYYNIADFSVVDYTGGMADLEAGRLRIIGDPEERFREDPVRMLRAVRFAAKLGFRIGEAEEEAIYELGDLLADIPAARLFDEVLKLLLTGYGVETYELLRHYDLFGELYPETEDALEEESEGFPRTLLAHALENTDRRIDDGLPVTPAFLLAALLWEPVRMRAEELIERGMPELEAMQRAGDEVVRESVRYVAFPKRFSQQSREIWDMQVRLNSRGGRRADRLMENPRFRAGYDFLVLRARSGEAVEELAEWWTRYQEANERERRELNAPFSGREGGGGGRARRGGRRPRRRKSPGGN